MTQIEFKKFVCDILDAIAKQTPEVDFPTQDWVAALETRLQVWEDYLK